MKQFNFDENQTRRRLVVIGLTVFLGLSIASNLLLVVERNDQTIMLIPGEMTKPWQISRVAYDRAYLADSSAQLAELYLEATPTTTSYRQENLLRWVHPASTQLIADRLNKESSNIRKQRLTTSFSISEIATKVDGDKATARVVGRYTRFVTDKPFNQENVVVIIEWLRDERGTARVSNLYWKELEKNETADNF